MTARVDSAVIDAPKAVSAGGRSFFEHVRACTLPPAGLELPPLEAIVEPGFRWPDIDLAIQGFSTFRAGTPDLRYLVRALACIDGWGSFASGRFSIETRLLGHAEKVAPPARAARAGSGRRNERQSRQRGLRWDHGTPSPGPAEPRLTRPRPEGPGAIR